MKYEYEKVGPWFWAFCVVLIICLVAPWRDLKRFPQQNGVYVFDTVFNPDGTVFEGGVFCRLDSDPTQQVRSPVRQGKLEVFLSPGTYRVLFWAKGEQNPREPDHYWVVQPSLIGARVPVWLVRTGRPLLGAPPPLLELQPHEP